MHNQQNNDSIGEQSSPIYMFLPIVLSFSAYLETFNVRTLLMTKQKHIAHGDYKSVRHILFPVYLFSKMQFSPKDGIINIDKTT